MINNKTLLNHVKNRQKAILSDYNKGYTIRFKDGPSVRSMYPGTDNAYRILESENDPFCSAKAIVVGIDLREYSRRVAAKQLFLTLTLHANIDRAISTLRDVGLLPQYEPRIIIQTGDGAYVVFFSPDEVERIVRPTDRSKQTRSESQASYSTATVSKSAVTFQTVATYAFSFLFTVNTLMEHDNVRNGFVDETPGKGDVDDFPVFPAYPRFAVSYDEVLLLADINSSLNCVGNGMVTCSRILSTDKGNHLLVHDKLIKELLLTGGLEKLGNRAWEQVLHEATLHDIKVKTGTFRFADVFGHYSDHPILHALGWQNQPATRYQIGSHDLSALSV